MRRCIEKETGKEFAAKIIDLSNDGAEGGGASYEATKQEVQILRHVAGHPFISESFVSEHVFFCFLSRMKQIEVELAACNGNLLYGFKCISKMADKTKYIHRNAILG